MKELPKLAALVACTGLTLAAAWSILDASPESVHATQACAPIEAGDFDRPNANSPLDAEFESVASTPINEENTELGPASEVEIDTQTDESQAHVDYYKDGDLVNVTGKDEAGTLRLSGRKVIRLTERVESDKTVDVIEPTDIADEEEKELLQTVKVLLEDLKKLAITEETDFDPDRVPSGFVATLLNDGVWTKYNAKGTRVEETSWLEGKRDGSYSAWHPDGGISQTGAYVNGLQNGLWSTWNAAGQLMCDMTYADGALHGAFCSYHSNGVMSSQGSFEKNQSRGIWSFYDRTGRETQQIDYSQQLEDSSAESPTKPVRRLKSRRG